MPLTSYLSKYSGNPTYRYTNFCQPNTDIGEKVKLEL